MKTLKFNHFAKTALLFCCALLTVGLFPKQAAAQCVNRDLIDRTGTDTINQEVIDRAGSALMILFGNAPRSSGAPTLCPYGGPQMGYPGNVMYIFPSGTGVYATGQTCNPVPIGCINCGVTMPTVNIILENMAVPKQIPDSVTIGKAAAINQLLLPGQLK